MSDLDSAHSGALLTGEVGEQVIEGIVIKVLQERCRRNVTVDQPVNQELLL